MYYDQFSSNSNKISLFILKNLVLTSDKKSDFILKILKRRFHQYWWYHTKMCMLVLHLLPLLNPWFIVEMYPTWAFSVGITLIDVHLNYMNWFYFLILGAGPLVILIGCLISLAPFARFYNDVYVNSFFPRTPKLWSSLPAECFPLTYDLNGFNSRVNRYLFFLGFLHETQLKKNGSS